MKLTATLLLILTLSCSVFMIFKSFTTDFFWTIFILKTVDANPRFKRDNLDDVLNEAEELIERGEDVLEKLPDSDLKDEITEKLETMKYYKHELEYAYNPFKIAHFELELLTISSHY
ncbi:hypothetical protein DERF_000401 [Dermatophagoides farinae]|uniref:Uncharacterized protein n=1 Tax=Dermatophagoides farinae TaxID=6954 RepID=A0A922I8T4_DERFA|nr:hypothetical protein DERF_000401 [Dermatophagoides farinae]